MCILYSKHWAWSDSRWDLAKIGVYWLGGHFISTQGSLGLVPAGQASGSNKHQTKQARAKAIYPSVLYNLWERLRHPETKLDLPNSDNLTVNKFSDCPYEVAQDLASPTECFVPIPQISTDDGYGWFQAMYIVGIAQEFMWQKNEHWLVLWTKLLFFIAIANNFCWSQIRCCIMFPLFLWLLDGLVGDHLH